MSDQANSLVSKFMFWKVAIFRGINGWFMAASMAFLAFTDSNESFKTSGWMAFRLAIFCFAAGSKYLDGFLDQTIQTLKDAARQSDDSNPRAFLAPPK